jgi:hypothetical protein
MSIRKKMGDRLWAIGDRKSGKSGRGSKAEIKRRGTQINAVKKIS